MKIKQLIILFLLWVIVINIIQGCSSNKKFELLNNQDIVFDRYLFSRDKLAITLQKSYFNYQDLVQFSSVGIQSPHPNLYQLFWVYKLMKALGVENNYKSELAFNYSLLEQSQNNLPDHLTTRYTIELGIELEKKSINDYLPKVLMQFDESDGLFFGATKNESLSEKLDATLEYVDILNHLQNNHFIKKAVITRLINLYRDDNIFKITNNDDDDDDIGNEVSVKTLIALKHLGVSTIAISDREDWYEKWKVRVFEKIRALDKQDLQFQKILLIKTFLEIREFFTDKRDYPDFLNDFLSELPNEIVQKNRISEIFQPQILYIILGIVTLDGDSRVAIQNYIDDNVISGFNKVGYTVFNIEDNYYGMEIAELINFPYDRESIGETINHLFEALFVEDSTINEQDKLKSVYFLVLSLDRLKMPIKNSEEIMESFSEYISRSSKIEVSKSIITDYNRIIHISRKLGIPLSQQDKKTMYETIKKINKDHNIVYKTSTAFELYQIIKYLDNDSLESEYIINIQNTLKSLKVRNGFKSNTDQNSPSFYSSFDGWKLKNYLKDLTDGEKVEIKSYVHEEFERDDYIGIRTKNTSDLDLKKLYYGMILSGIYE